MKFIVCAVFSLILVVVAFSDHAPNPVLDEYNGQYYDYLDDAFNSQEVAGDNDSKDIDEKLWNELFSDESKDSDTFEGMKDYQIEDNRFDSNEEKAEEVHAENDDTRSRTDNKPIPQEDSIESVANLGEPQENKNNEDIDESLVEEAEPDADDAFENNESGVINEDVEDFNGFWGDALEDNEAPLPVPENDNYNKILEETREILKEDSDSFGSDLANEPKSEEIERSMDEIKKTNPENEDVADYLDKLIENYDTDSKDIEKMIDEVKKFLEDSNSNNEQENKSDEDVFSENNDDSNEDTVEKAYADLNADLETLFKTFDKLKDDESQEEENDEKIDNNVKDYEEKFGWPYKEAAVLAARMDDYEDIDDSNLSDIFKENADDSADEDGDSIENVEDPKNSEEQNIDFDKDALQANIESVIENVEGNAKIKDSEEEFHELDTDYDDTNDIIEGLIEEIFPDKHPYGEDGLDNSQPNEADAEEIEQVKDNEHDNIVVDSNNAVEQTTRKSIMVDDLSDEKLDVLMAQFQIGHQEDFDVHSEDFNKNVAPIHIKVTADEPVVVTSPNYPNPYPTNNVIDWIFEGEGTGIELNITDFAVNGALGDYLLVKPGGIDESGHEGLIFSYRLHSERKYRFFDVKRMFVRFEAKLGMPYFRGFQFSVKMIFPPTEEQRIESPDAEPVLNRPKYTVTLYLAGLTQPQFTNIQNDFLTLVADMAKEYIKDNGIYYGYNSTLEVTQITGTAVCRIHWPNYETCIEVTFGVPLNYGDEDLEPRLNTEDLNDMWTTMILRDEFSARLDAMGIKEYLMPNDRTVLTVWLVIGAGVVISMAMLAFALWRFSCFEDYTRMKAFGETDSIKDEKRNLDLYPTPHQTLPPLYSENEYKWVDENNEDSTRVDMGGFANKSYTRDDLFNFDSDEDVIAPRDRYATNV